MISDLEKIRDLEGQRTIQTQKIHGYFLGHHNSSEELSIAYNAWLKRKVIDEELQRLVAAHFDEIMEGEFGWPDGDMTPHRLARLLAELGE